jgi:hypothetical protein
LRQHHYLACREPNKDFEQTHLPSIRPNGE